jgi:hypothetical protein
MPRTSALRRRDVEEIEDTLACLSYLAMHFEGHLAKLDITPLMVLPSDQRAKAVGAQSCSAAHSTAGDREPNPKVCTG